MVLGLLDQPQIFSQLYLIELLWFLTGLGLLELWQLTYLRLLTGFGILVFFKNLSLMEFQVSFLALFVLFSVIDGLEWFWMESLHKNIQLTLEFLKAPFLVLNVSYYTLMTFLTMLSVIMLSMLMILLSILCVISGLLISMLGKLSWFPFTSLITLVLLIWQWMGLFLRKNHLSKCWGWPSLLNWIGALTLSLFLKLPPSFNSFYEVSFSWGCSGSL